MKNRLAIIDDKINFCKSLAHNMKNVGYGCSYATNSLDAITLITGNVFDVVLLDISLGDEDGLELLRKIRAIDENLPVIMITGYGTIELAVTSIKLGAFDFCQKPVNFSKLLNMIEHAIKLSDLNRENENLRKRIIQLSPKFIIRNEEMIELGEKARKFAATKLPILICGESGTGKEVLAEFIHNNSPRSTGELLKINCAAFPENLLDNELFGHEKGAYTGADSIFIGVFEKAHQSTLLLDELGDMALATQAKILRVLQSNEIRRIGSNTIIRIDVRFLASTNKDLHQLMLEKQFREDLFYRLNTAVLHITPLRKRKDDLPYLVSHFLKEFSEQNGKHVSSISDRAFDRLNAHDWPGNIRELKSVINYAAVITTRDFIDREDLPPLLTDDKKEPAGRPILQENEKRIILAMLEKYNYNKIKTAEALKVTRKTLYNKMRKYGLPTRN